MPINLVVDLVNPLGSSFLRSAVATSRTLRLRRRRLLGVPALVVAASAAVAAAPASASAAPAPTAKRVECLADLLGEA